MTKKTFITSDKYAGVDVTYDSKAGTVTLSGWYNTYAGIAPQTVPVREFLEQLGLTVKECEKAWRQ